MDADFLIKIELASPLILQGPGMMGDSLLAGLLTQRYDGDYVRGIADLPIAKVHDVPQMSMMLPYSLARAESSKVVIIRNIMRDFDHNPLMAEVLDKMPSRSDLAPSEGPLGNFSNIYESYDIPYVFFMGRGDIRRVEQILMDLTFIGSQSRRGYGQVSDFTVSEVETYNPWYGIVGGKNGQNMVLRPIPIRLRDKFPPASVYTLNNETWHCPYYSGYSNAVVEECMVPLLQAGESFHQEQIENELSHLVIE